MVEMDDTEPPQSKRESRARMMRRRRLTAGIAAGVLVVLLGTGGAVWAITTAQPEPEPPKVVKTPTPSPTPQPTIEPEPTPEPEPEPEPEPSYDLDTPSSLTVVVNKQRSLNPVEWAPDDLTMPEGIPNVWGHPLRTEASTALQQMYAAASEAGLPFTITSGYRDYWLQKEIYDGLVAEGGVEYADNDTARPGHSEHQTGLAVDLYGEEGCQLSACFGETATGIWLRDNSYRFGYILRYHDGEQATVGYTYEPWHFRYVGIEVATAMHNEGIINLEDFFGLPPAPTN